MNKLLGVTDKTAIALSLICVVHCIALPLVLVALPSVSVLLALNDEVFHLWLLYGVIPISFFAIISGFFHHRDPTVLVISGFGMAALISASMLGHDTLGETEEIMLTVLGSALIAFAHIRNLHQRRASRERN